MAFIRGPGGPLQNSIWISNQEESAEERFLRSWLAEKISAQGARMAQSKAQTDVLLDVKARVFGVHQTPQGLEKYLKSLLQEWTVRKGGKVGPGEWRMDVYLPVLGSSATRRDLSYQQIPLYYSERFRATGQLVVVVRDGGGTVAGIWSAGKGGDLADIYLMRILGPFDTPF